MAFRYVFQSVVRQTSNQILQVSSATPTQCLSSQLLSPLSVRAYSSDSKFSVESIFTYLKDKYSAEKRKKFESETPSSEAAAAASLEFDLAEAPSSPEDASASAQAPRVPKPYEALIDPKYGYAAISGWSVKKPTAAVGETSSEPTAPAVHPKVHPRKIFTPGETYVPQDLNPFAEQLAAGKSYRFRPRSTHQEVTEMADFKNVSFLTQFLSPAGRIQPRRVTKLTEPLQRRIAKSVKLARNMALMAGEARLDKLHLTRVRQEELHRYQLKKSVQVVEAVGEDGAAARVTKKEMLEL